MLFSILYGTMLQSLPGGLWPLGRWFNGYIDHNGEIGYTPGWEDLKQNEIIKKWRLRVLASFIILNFFPLIYFWMIFFILKFAKINVYHPVNMIFLFWASLGSFGFYRIYYILVCKYFKKIFL
ncbi:MAG: hypothetical protein ACOC56_05915 [Atribacterota bacterium]